MNVKTILEIDSRGITVPIKISLKEWCKTIENKLITENFVVLDIGSSDCKAGQAYLELSESDAGELVNILNNYIQRLYLIRCNNQAPLDSALEWVKNTPFKKMQIKRNIVA